MDPMAAKAAMRASAQRSAHFSEPEGEKVDPAEQHRASAGDDDGDAHEEDAPGLVKLPPQAEHTYFVLIRAPKGGIPSQSGIQKVAARLASRFDKSDNVVLRATRSEPYLAENGKHGRHYIVLTASVSDRDSERIAKNMATWPEVVGLHRKYSIESTLFQAFADVYDTSNGACLPVPDRRDRRSIKLQHVPSPAISLDALENMVDKLDLSITPAQVRSSFRSNADSMAPRVSWDTIALVVARCLRPHRQTIEDALAVLEAASGSRAPDGSAPREPGTVTIIQLHTALLALRQKHGLDKDHISALVQRAHVFSEGSKYINYKLFLLRICSGREAMEAPPAQTVARRQQTARQLEGNRSREVARNIAADWKALTAKEREKYEKDAAEDYLRYCREKDEEALNLRRSRAQHDGEDEGSGDEGKEHKHELPRWGVDSKVRPPRSAFGFYSSLALQRYLKDDSFNSQYRVRDERAALAGPDEEKKSAGGEGNERLMSYRGFCTWFNRLPLGTKAQLFSMPPMCMVSKCPASYRDMVAQQLARAQRKKLSDESASQMRDAARIQKILRARPGLEVLFEAYALKIPESVTQVDSRNVTKGNVYKAFQSVFIKSEMLTMSSAMRMAQDFHIIPMLASRQAVAAAYKRCKIVQKTSRDERSGLTLAAFVRFLEGVAAASSMPALEKKMRRTERRAASLLDKFRYLTGENVLATSSVAVLDLKLRLKMNPRAYDYVAQNVPVLLEFLSEKKETMARRLRERTEKTKELLRQSQISRRWARLTRLLSLGFLYPSSPNMVAIRQVFVLYCSAKGGLRHAGTKDARLLRMNLPVIKQFLVDVKVVPDSNLAAGKAAMPWSSKPLLTSTELAGIYADVSSSSAVSQMAGIPTSMGSTAKAGAPADDEGGGDWSDALLDDEGEGTGASAKGPAKVSAPAKPNEHQGLGLPEFVELLHAVAFRIYFSDDVLDAAYPKDEDKVALPPPLRLPFRSLARSFCSRFDPFALPASRLPRFFSLLLLRFLALPLARPPACSPSRSPSCSLAHFPPASPSSHPPAPRAGFG